MNIKMNIGKRKQTIDIKEKNLMDILLPNKIDYSKNEKHIIKKSLENPIGTEKLGEIVNSGEKIVIVTSDITRPLPSKKILPYVLDELYKSGIRKEDILIVFALGSHRQHTEDEKIYLVGEEIYNTIECIDSDINDYINLGLTKKGTPVEIFSRVAKADRRICLGNIEYHYFAGYSGGSKAIMPGVSTPKAIQANHSNMTSKNARVGLLYDNPVRDDLNDAINYCNIDFIVNVILDEDKNIMHAVSGHHITAHKEGCKFLDNLYKKEIKQKADIVVVSQGGYPKDINLYQTQKALANAEHSVKDDGIIILVGSCIEGFGNDIFEKWMLESSSYEEIIEKIEKDFVLGGHKAAAISLVLRKAQIYLVSDMDEEIVKQIYMKPFKNIQDAYDEALEIKGNDAQVLVMPFGGSTLPYMNIN